MMRMRFATPFVALAAAVSLTAPAGAETPPPEERARILITERTTGSYLGIGVAEITADRAKALNLREERGVEVTRVEEGSPAEKGGLKTGDVVLEYNGQRVEGVEQFMRMVRETPPGREVKLTISRNGSAQTLAVKTGTRKGWPVARTFEFPRLNMGEFRMPDVPRANMSWRSVTLGIEAESLEPQLAGFFGVKEGVLVRSVIKGSPADKAGLKAGDVITKVDDTHVSTPREITSAIRPLRSKNTVTITAVREKREISLTVSLEDGSSSGPATRVSTR